MKIQHVKSFIAAATGLAIIVTIMATGALAQTTDTRLGKLNFEKGFPTEETTRKLFDEMDYQRAVQAYLWAYSGGFVRVYSRRNQTRHRR